MLNEIEIYASTTPFKSGDGKKVLSFQKVIFPVNIENKSCRISCEIVKETIPFFLRKLSMKWAGTITNMQKVEATFLILKLINTYPKMAIIEKQIRKIQKEFGHSLSGSVKKIICNSGFLNSICQRLLMSYHTVKYAKGIENHLIL